MTTLGNIMFATEKISYSCNMDPSVVIAQQRSTPEIVPSSGNNSFVFLFIGIANIDLILALLIGIVELLFTAIPDSYVEIYNIYNIKGETIQGVFPHQSWFFMSVLIFAIFWLILEFWLYQILCKGALELDEKQLNRWLNVRMIFLMLNIVQAIYRIIELQFCLYDIVYTPVLMYRVLEIIFVKGLTVEILKAQPELNV